MATDPTAAAAAATPVAVGQTAAADPTAAAAAAATPVAVDPTAAATAAA